MVTGTRFSGDIDSTNIPPGIYWLNDIDSYTHASLTSQGYGPTWCMFYQSPCYNTQIIDTGSQILTRKYTGNPASWGRWSYIENYDNITSWVNSKIANKFHIYSAFPKTTVDANRLKITVPRSQYLFLSGLIISRYGVYAFNMSENGASPPVLSCSASKLFSTGETITTSVSSYTALFASSSTWNNFGVIFMSVTDPSNFIFATDKV